jgi:PncC family amidohydrolase
MGLEVVVGDLLRRVNLKLAVAESCTGGLLGSTLVDVPGSSDYFLGGVIAYEDSVKVALLGVSPSLIQEHGAVSAPCTLMMARGARNAIGADVVVSITGIAGPTGARPNKPVGTTYIGLAAPGVEKVEHFCWSGDRTQNREQSVQAALSILVDFLSTHAPEAHLSTAEKGAP